MSGQSTTHRAFGLQLQCHFSLSELPVEAVDAVDVELTLASDADARRSFSGSCEPPITHTGAVGAGHTFTIERGSGADYLIDLEADATFLLSVDGRHLICAPADCDGLAWRRFLLDTVLATTALVHGFEALHAAAFAHDNRAVAIVGGESAGKSTLLAEALSRGDAFLCDDVLCISRDRSAGPVAHAGPPLMNLAPVLPGGARAEQFGRVLATFDDECWIAIDQPTVAPRALGAVVLLDRSGRSQLFVERLEPNPTLLLQHSLRSGPSHDRRRARFDVFADVASRAPMLRLSAPASEPAAKVFDVLEDELHATVSNAGERS